MDESGHSFFFDSDPGCNICAISQYSIQHITAGSGAMGSDRAAALNPIRRSGIDQSLLLAHAQTVFKDVESISIKPIPIPRPSLVVRQEVDDLAIPGG